MSHIGNGLATPRIVCSLADSIVYRVTTAAAWTLSHFRDLAHHELTAWECEKQGLPEGSKVPHIYINRMPNAPWWRFDAWSDGDCFHIRALGRWSEIHYIPKGHQEATTV
ncbi:hypothetical protein [Azohydromonas caseinilytica]|uniref:Uncharacterized protein n=1 Tax=Azohydromonas caseinilytica TaxID=2728836 RepID=A0A848FA18_9BURK|nr:hypothetical protein [Azohydromonas caseinilytica]NML15595.1 hypothetical protein [Azohydromonas caseinilytica]